jgi:hypothetical protein
VPERPGDRPLGPARARRTRADVRRSANCHACVNKEFACPSFRHWCLFLGSIRANQPPHRGSYFAQLII